jgi:hypothetical protein
MASRSGNNQEIRMSDYKSEAKASRQEKLKAMGFASGGGVSPIWKSVPPALPSGASRQSVSPPISKASAPLVAGEILEEESTVKRIYCSKSRSLMSCRWNRLKNRF